MEAWLTKLPMPQFLRDWIILPLWRAIVRLSRPEVRIVTGGISFYALFSIFPLIYLTLTLLFSHGNAEDIGMAVQYFREARRVDFLIRRTVGEGCIGIAEQLKRTHVFFHCQV